MPTSTEAPAAQGPIPQTHPRASYEALKPGIDQAIARVMTGGQYILGPETEAFEQEFAAYIGAADAIGVANGTDALVLCLMALDLKPGEGVITVSHTAVATVAAIELAGGVPVLVDIDPDSFTIAIEDVEAVLRRLPIPIKAIIAVHLYGHPAPMSQLRTLADSHGVALVEDACQAHGAKVGQARVGSLGDLAAFSFYPTKNLGGFGDGGAVTARTAALGQRVRSLRQYGWKDRYVSQEPGLNSRLDELQAAILRIKLPHLDAWNAARRRIAGVYAQGLADAGMTLPSEADSVEHVYHQYVVQVSARDSLQQSLSAAGVGTAIHYPRPVHMQPAYAGRLRTGPSRLFHTEAVCPEILSLPMHPQLSQRDGQRVVEAVLSAQRSKPS